MNPHITRSVGIHIVVIPKRGLSRGFDNPEVCARAFKLAAKIAKIMIDKVKIVGWANLQYNGNWGMRAGKPFFHVHIYGRSETSKDYGMSLKVPRLPGTFNNKPLPKQEAKLLADAFKKYL